MFNYTYVNLGREQYTTGEQPHREFCQNIRLIVQKIAKLIFLKEQRISYI